MLPFAIPMLMQPASGGGGGPAPGSSQRQALVFGPNGPTYVNTTTAADKQYAVPNFSYLNEQS